jgi:hypothetical protein
MANEITSGLLSASLTDELVNQAFMIARSNRPGVLQTVSFGASTVPYEGYKMSWLNGRVDAQGSALTGAIDNVVTTVPVVNGSAFRVGATASLADSDEVMLVTVVTGNNLTVVRGFGGTTAAASSGADDEILVDSVGREENSLAENDGIYQPTREENNFQTMDTAIEMSRRALATLQFGNTNDLSFQLEQRVQQLVTQLDRALVRGRKAVATISGKEHTYTGGLAFWTTQAGAINTDNGAAALDLDAINNVNAEIVKRGGMANTIAVGINLARQLNDLVGTKYSSQRLADWTNDEGSVTRLPSDLPLIGSVTTIVIDTNINDDELFLYDSTKINVVPMGSGNADTDGNWSSEDATQKGQDGQRVRILGDFAMEIRQHETHMARIYNIA